MVELFAALFGRLDENGEVFLDLCLSVFGRSLDSD
jgi:hypothetical protein